jgi:hypothetical protein
MEEELNPKPAKAQNTNLRKNEARSATNQSSTSAHSGFTNYKHQLNPHTATIMEGLKIQYPGEF